jgi:hypothetical protein
MKIDDLRLKIDDLWVGGIVELTIDDWRLTIGDLWVGGIVDRYQDKA